MSVPSYLLSDILKAVADQHDREDSGSDDRVTPEQLNLYIAACGVIEAVRKSGGHWNYKGLNYNRIRGAFEALARVMPPEPTEECPD